MDFLLKYNMTSDDIDKIINANDKAIINNIVINKHNVQEIVEYLLDLGVKNESIKELFILQIGMFFKSKKEISQAFEEYELDSIVKSLNYDVNTFDLIEFV